MTTITNADLAAKAGVNPWALYQQLAGGDPAQIDQLASAFSKAGGYATFARQEANQAQNYAKHGYTISGSSPIKDTAEVKKSGLDPATLGTIGQILDGIATELYTAATKAKTEVHNLDTAIKGISSRLSKFESTIGPHLPPDDRESTEQSFINEAVTAVRTHGATVKKLLHGYEEQVYSATKQMADLGYVPTANLDDLSGQADSYVTNLQKQARNAADKIKNHHNLDGSWASNAHNVLSQNKALLDDPYFASAFYSELGSQETQLLPEMLYQSGSNTARQDLQDFSKMFGVAVTNQNDAPGMADVANSFLTKPPVAAVSFDRAAMASAGNFPPDWLAKAARVNALDDFAKHGAQGFNGMGFDVQSVGRFAADVGVSNNVVAAWGQDLGHNPEASREALATMGSSSADVTVPSDPGTAYQQNIHKLIAYGKSEDYPGDVSRAYGSMFEAASGADNETDGYHSSEAIDFTKALFNDLGANSGADANSVKDQPVAAQNFAKIAGSYVQEMAAGSNSDGNSVVNTLPDASKLAGQHATFGVPPDLVKSVMRTFVGDAGATQTFDSSAGTQLHAAQLAAAQLDGRTGAVNEHNLENTMKAYGTVAGLENTTTRDVVGARDESAEHQNELVRNVLSAGVDLIPGEKVAETLAVKIPSTAWDVAKHMTNMGLEQAYGATADPRYDALNDTSHTLAVTGMYQNMAILQQAHYPGTDHIPPQLIDPASHQMLPVQKVLEDPHLRKVFSDYMLDAARTNDGTHNAAYYEASNAAGQYQLGFDQNDEHNG